MNDRLENLTRGIGVAQGPSAKLRVLGVIAAGRLPGRQGPQAPVDLRMRPLDGRSIGVRPGTTDLSNAVAYLSHHLYLPPPEMRNRDLQLICELGTNMGVALTALAHTYANARLIGVEPDTDNLELARRNVAAFGQRVKVLQAAVWHEPGIVRLRRDTGRGEHGFAVEALDPADSGATDGLRAHTIDDVLDVLEPDRSIPVDYLHVSLEGSEEGVFEAGGDWTGRVLSLRVEAHPYFGYTAERCATQLGDLGFRAWPAPELPDKWVYAVRDRPASRSQIAS